MTGRTLLRLSGVALLIGSLVYVVGAVLNIPFGSGEGFPQPPVTLSWLIAFLFIIPGLPGFYIRQAGAAKTIGLIGWLVFLWHSLLVLGFSVSAGVHLPALAPSAMTPQPGGAFIALAVYGLTVNFFHILGTLLLGIATLRARVFPSLVGWLFIVTVVLAAMQFIIGQGLIGAILGSLAQLAISIALGWSGFLLLKGEGKSEQASAVQSSGIA